MLSVLYLAIWYVIISIKALHLYTSEWRASGCSCLLHANKSIASKKIGVETCSSRYKVCMVYKEQVSRPKCKSIGVWELVSVYYMYLQYFDTVGWVF